jgi:hypothetical protein
VSAPAVQRRDVSADAPRGEPARVPGDKRSHRGRTQRRSARRHRSGGRRLCWACGAPALPERYVCERHAAQLDRRAAELRRTREAA